MKTGEQARRRNGEKMKMISILVGLLLLPIVVSGHHSRAHYTGEMRELEGDVVRLRWGNPHTAVLLQTTTETGNGQAWRIDFLGTRGIARESLAIGQRLTLAGLESVRGPGDLLATNMLLADGNELLLGAVEPLLVKRCGACLHPRTRGCSCRRCRGEPGAVSRMESARRGLGTLQPPPAQLLLPGERGKSGRGSGRRLSFGAWQSEPYTEAAIAARADWDSLEQLRYALRAGGHAEAHDESPSVRVRG